MPILFHCVDQNGRPLIPSAPTGAEADMLRRSAHTAIPAAVELTHQYWMPTRFKTRPYTVVGTGDYNGDGTSDVLLQNGGTVVDWIMKNGQYQSGNICA